ncbi:hypothetical protein LMJ53_15340 [Rheinheimera sp. UJ51]|uniref:hypothetical protein n=1 Tax=Rheinheimera sp. UJ51 TaxID=2892446 RepID=UPI001E5558EA|nr:hypothetical protein [Rheinheimera sp. UJ51]MCC5453096.1 hypothetical protein [Rheinheimera sp. UJ51]
MLALATLFTRLASGSDTKILNVLANGEKVFYHMIRKRLKSQTMHYYFRKAKESKSLANGEKVVNYPKLQPGEAAWFNTRLHRRRIKANYIKNSTLTTVLILNKAL